LETSVPDFSFRDALALLAFTLLGVFPFPCPAPLDRSATLLRARRHDPTHLKPTLPLASAVLGCYLSGTSGKVPFWVLIPMLQSFKEQGSWRYLFRGSRPL